MQEKRSSRWCCDNLYVSTLENGVIVSINSFNAKSLAHFAAVINPRTKVLRPWFSNNIPFLSFSVERIWMFLLLTSKYFDLRHAEASYNLYKWVFRIKQIKKSIYNTAKVNSSFRSLKPMIFWQHLKFYGSGDRTAQHMCSDFDVHLIAIKFNMLFGQFIGEFQSLFYLSFM